MDCSLVAERLVEYHFDVAEDAVRDGIDAHLLGCASCLRTYLSLKREIVHASRARPSDALRERLRASVEETFRKPRPNAIVRALRRPVPLYQSLAFAAVVALLFTALAALRPKPAARVVPGELLDTSRTSPATLTLY